MPLIDRDTDLAAWIETHKQEGEHERPRTFHAGLLEDYPRD